MILYLMMKAELLMTEAEHLTKVAELLMITAELLMTTAELLMIKEPSTCGVSHQHLIYQASVFFRCMHQTAVIVRSEK